MKRLPVFFLTQSIRQSFAAGLIFTGCFLLDPFGFQPLHAQQTQQPSANKKKVLLSEPEWKAVEGIFQSGQNKDMYVQFTAKGGVLIAKLLWNNNEIHLAPESSLHFSSSQEGNQDPINITFIKTPDGSINQVTVANNGTWNRTKDYTPVTKKEMEHTPEQLKPFEGLYRLRNDSLRFIQFMVKENKLILKQHWDGNEIEFVPDSATDFFSPAVPLFSLSFVKDKDGNIAEAIAFKRDRWDKMKKFNPAVAELKAFEGKFQFKDDPDNYLQVTAKEGHLIVRQLWDSKEIIVEPLAEGYFYNSEQSYPFQLLKDKDGMVKQALVLGIDLFNKVKKDD